MKRQIPLKEQDHGEDYERNYLRTTIQHLIRYDKPVIIKANYKPLQDESVFISFRNVRLYKSDVQMNRICDHINLFQNDILDIYGEFWNRATEPYQALYLVCRPYIYHDAQWRKRGGFKLTTELGIPPILISDTLIRQLPKDSYVDAAKFALGKYVRKQQQSKNKDNKKLNRNEISKSKRHRAKERNQKKNLQNFRKTKHVEKLIQLLEQQ